MNINTCHQTITKDSLHPWLVLPAKITFMVLCAMVVAGDAWAVQSILFAVQTTNDPGITAGIIAIGGAAVGVIAVGGFAVGVIAVGGSAVGLIAFGGGAIGVIAVGGGAVGYYSLGAGAVGRYVLAYAGLGRYLFTLNRRDREAVELFCRWLPRLGKYVR